MRNWLSCWSPLSPLFSWPFLMRVRRKLRKDWAFENFLLCCVFNSRFSSLSIVVIIEIDLWQRFEHNSTDKSAARKIDTPIRFPAVLNMLEFTTVVAGMQESDEAEDGSPEAHRIRCAWLYQIEQIPFNVALVTQARKPCTSMIYLR